jgi:hypothetical protein
MATITAQFLVGENHPNHGGIIPCGQMSFFENDRHVYVLSPFGDAAEDKLIRWVPSIEHTLEDGLLMIAVHVMGAFELQDIANDTYNPDSGALFEVYEHMNEATHQKLLEEMPGLPGFPKLVITVLDGSHLLQHLSAIKRYSMDVELCFAGYSREKSEWTQGTRINDFIDFLIAKPS